MRAEASAPSNIALIKYMGKSEETGNLPSNASLSYSVEGLRSFVTLEPISGPPQDRWEPLEGFSNIYLSETGVRKFLGHFERLKRHWKITGNYLVRSANNFPADCGIASSASSFAALTRATAELARQLNPKTVYSDFDLSKLSRAGSGSSCRSMFTPWAVWRGEGAEPLELDLTLEHAVILIDEGKKAVSTSEAHRRVTSSLLFEGRKERAETRLESLILALKGGDWRASFELCWNEFWDMHALFETSVPSFGYMKGQTFKVLESLREVWRLEGDGPLVTMDAGANVHVFLRPEQTPQAERWLVGMKTIKSWSNERV